MSDIVTPVLRNVLTDITGSMLSYQFLGRCAKQEMDMMDCMEAYGYGRGVRRCKDFIDEYHECHTRKKQYARFIAMRKERERQIRCGQLTGDKEYVTPRVDSY